MTTSTETLERLAQQEYKYGFVTDIEPDTVPPGLNEDIVRADLGEEGRARVAARVAPEGLPPLADDGRSRRWPNVDYPPIDYQAIIYYSAPKPKKTARRASTRSTRSCCETYEKLGIPLDEQKRLAGVAVDAVFDSVSVATTFKEQARRSWASSSAPSPRRCRSTPSWCKKYLGSVVPYTDNFFAALNSAVFTRRLVRATSRRACAARWSCRPTSASTPPNTGQFERTLIVADEGAYVSYLEGCTAPHARREPAARRGGRAGRPRRRRDQVLDGAELVPGRQGRQGRHLQLRHQARRLPRARARRSPGPRSRPARRSPGSTRAASCRATTRSASSTRWR